MQQITKLRDWSRPWDPRQNIDHLDLDDEPYLEPDEAEMLCLYMQPPHGYRVSSLEFTTHFYLDLLLAQAVINRLSPTARADFGRDRARLRLRRTPRLHDYVGIRYLALDLSARSETAGLRPQEAVAAAITAGQGLASVEALAYLVHNPAYLIGLAEGSLPGMILGGYKATGTKGGKWDRAPVIYGCDGTLIISSVPMEASLAGAWCLPTWRRLRTQRPHQRHGA